MGTAPKASGLAIELKELASPRPSLLKAERPGGCSEYSVLSLGNPRAGTTLLFKMLRSCGAGYRDRIPEGYLEHPRNSRDGLLTIARYLDQPVVFLRIVRHPVECFDSLYHWKPYFFDERMFEYEVEHYRAESDNWWAQADEPPPGCWFVTVKYATLLQDISELSAELPEWALPDLACWNTWLQERWNTVPSRLGKLSDGKQGELLMSADQYHEIVDRLSDVIEREGLETWLGP